LFAALNTVEPPILDLVTAKFVEGDEALGRAAPASSVQDRIRARLSETFRSPWRCRLARWCVQRGGPDDGGGATQVKTIGYSDGYPNLSAYVARGEARPRLQARFRSSIGGFHWQATDRLTKVRICVDSGYSMQTQECLT